MSNDMPDWLAGLVSAPEDEDDDQLLAAAMPQMRAVEPHVTAPQPQAAVAQSPVIAFEDEDMMADLRSQVAVEEPPPEPLAKKTRSRYVFGLLPWQIFFLAVMMFLDVAVIGMLFLVMLGRVVLPF
ncbi:MAG: hypothetical protein JXR84_05190 [Anaerolineae bacterium]|nr:hypothetical protein [Anaerolineae bacterium]